MARIFRMAFELAGRLDASFRSSFQGANDTMSRTRREIRELRNAQRTLDESFRQGAINQQTHAAASAQNARQLRDLNGVQGRMAAAQNMQREAQAGKDKYAGMMVNGAAMAAPFVMAAKTAVDFEAKMSKVKAITNASEADFQKLTATARQLGATTQFSASQASEAMSYLGMAGWKTEQIIAGMPGLLSLAAAGGTDLARTADIISDDLTAFGLSADKAGHMADVFAVTITNTNTNVEMLGETMKYAAPVAKAFGASLEETSALAGLMANSGIKASQAGTALRAGFLRLAGPPRMAAKELEKMGMSLDNINTEQREAAAAMASLGISMEDLSGKPKKMSAILRELKNRTADMAQEQKLAALKAIFGTEAATGWLAVLDQGPDTFDALVAKLEQSDGAANKMAKTMTDNAKGAMIQLASATESVAISFGSILLPVIAQGAKKIAGIATQITEWAETNPQTAQTLTTVGVAVAGLTVGVGALGYAFNFVKGGVAGAMMPLISMHKWLFVTRDAVTGLSRAQQAARAAQTAWTAAVSAGQAVMNGSALSRMVASFRSLASVSRVAAIAQAALNVTMYACPLVWIVGGIMAAVAAGYLLYKNWDTVKAGAVALFDCVKGSLATAYDAIVAFCDDIPGNIAYGIGYAIGFIRQLPEKAAQAGAEMIDAIGGWLFELPERSAEAGTALIASVGEWASGAYDAALDWIGKLPGAIMDKLSGAGDAVSGLWDHVSGKFSVGVEVSEAPPAGRQAALSAAFGEVAAPDISGAAAQMAATLDSGFSGALAGLSSRVEMAVGEAGAWFSALPERAAQAGTEIVDAAAAWGQGLYDTVGGWIEAAIDAEIRGWKIVLNFIAEIPGKIAYGIGYAIGYLSELPGRIASAGTEMIAKTVAWAQETYYTAVTWTTQTVIAVGAWFAALPGRMIAAGTELIAATVSWAQDAYSTAVAWTATLVEGAYTLLMELPGRSLEAGAALIESVEAWASGAYQAALNWISQIPSLVSGAIADAGASISNWWSGVKENFQAGAAAGAKAGGGELGGHAAGGIFTQPHIAWFAEGGDPEAAIPINNNPRSVGLLQRTNEMMGNPLGGGGRGGVNAVFNPVVTIQGSANDETVNRLVAELEHMKNDFMEQLQSMRQAPLQAERVRY